MIPRMLYMLPTCQVLEKVLQWRENIVKFENEQYKNGLSSGEFTVVMGYGSDLNLQYSV